MSAFRAVLLILLLSIASQIAAAEPRPASASIPADLARALAAPKRLLIYRLLPDQKAGDFHGTTILAHREITTPRDLQEIAADLRTSLQTQDGSAFCFQPHHGVRILAGQRFYDLVLCYHCHSYQLHTLDRPIRSGPLGGESTTLDRFLPPPTK